MKQTTQTISSFEAKTPKEVFKTLHDIRLNIKDQVDINDYILEGRKH